MKFQYPITTDYVRDWTVTNALRELIANGIDGEVTTGGRFTARHDTKKEILHLTNAGVTVDAKALYFGGTSKYGDNRLIGQYGEGLKIAMLVCARSGIKLVIKNGEEVWTPAIEQDKLGHMVLTVNIRKGSATNADFHVEVHGVNKEAWHALQDMFLALRQPVEIDKCEMGEVLRDPEYVGKIFVKGVYCTTRPNYTTGYNFFALDIGRDRRIPSGWDMDYQISQIWKELATRDAAYGKELYKVLRKDGAEAEAFRYMSIPEVSKSLVEQFKEEFGDEAYPTTSVSEASELGHLGKTGVMLGGSLAAILKKEMPAKAEIQEKLKREVVSRVQFQDLTPDERKVLERGLELAKAATGRDPGEITTIVEFREPGLRGLHKSGEITIARNQLGSVGGFLVTLLHEYSHEFGSDGEKNHVDAIQFYVEKLVNWMEEMA